MGGSKANRSRPKRTSPAFAYLRVSGRSQIDGHGFDRQKEAISKFAKRAGYGIVGEYRDAGVSGTEAERPGFEAMVAAMLVNHVRTIIVEDLSRLAREYRIQEQILIYLVSKGLTLISANTGEEVTAAIAYDPTKKALIQIQGVFAELGKSLLVRKLAKARKAKKEETGRCEGRKPYGSKAGEAEVLARIRQLHRKPRGGKRLSYGQIADRLNEEGHRNRSGKLWGPANVFRILNPKKSDQRG